MTGPVGGQSPDKQVRRPGRTWAVTFVLVGCAVLIVGVWLASQPRVGPAVEVSGTLDMSIRAGKEVRWTDARMVCERSPYDGVVSNLRSPIVGYLRGHTVWTVLQLDFPGNMVLAIGQAGPTRPLYDTTGE